ncbi:MAG: hypothetical protein ACTSR8_03795 [Promethearchaeota archaeon]
MRVKKKTGALNIESDKIELQKGEYIKFLGITSTNRTPLYNNNQKFVYLLELANNLDFIATSILGGVLDKMLLISASNQEEKTQFLVKNGIIYMVYGVFPDKKGKWVLEQMAKHYSSMLIGKDVDQLNKLEKYNIEKKFSGMMKFILDEYLTLQEIFSDQDIPYVEDKLRVDYLGLSSKSIGVISLLMGEEIHVDVPDIYEDPVEKTEMKESILTAKIEAIAANTLGNTGAVPRWIAVKLGFQSYRFLTFKEYKNDYYLSMLSEGNLLKLKNTEENIEPLLSHVIETPFSGNLQPFNQLKAKLRNFLNTNREFS